MDIDAAIHSQLYLAGLCSCPYCHKLSSKSERYCSSCGVEIRSNKRCQEKSTMSPPTHPKAEEDSIESCRYTLHCQLTLSQFSERVKAYMEKFRSSCKLERDTQQQFDSALRVLQKQVEIETRSVLTKYLTLWKRFEKANGDVQQYMYSSESKVIEYKCKIEELEQTIETLRQYRREEQAGENLMQTFWEKEKEILRDHWESECAARQHEVVTNIIRQADAREKQRMIKLHEQKEAEIKAIEQAIIGKNKSQMEFMASQVALACKTKMERRLLIAYDAIDQRHQTALEQQKKRVEELEGRLEVTQQALQIKLAELEEKEKQLLSRQTTAVEREHHIRETYEAQLTSEREQSKALRRQLEYTHSKRIEQDLSKLDNFIV